MLETPEKIRELQKKLYLKAKREKEYRFYLLYDKLYRMDILTHAYNLVKANKGTCGIDCINFEDIEKAEGGKERYLKAIADELKEKSYKPKPVRRVYIPKPDGSKRPLGIPTIKDRIVEMATKIVIEPIFEADFHENSYGFRPKRNAHQAMDTVSLELHRGKTQIIDADITKYFDTIPHDKLLKLVAGRIVDKHILRLIKMWLKAPIAEETEEGKKRYKGNDKGTPQGGVISPLLANIYLNAMDEMWQEKKAELNLKATLVRYADDFVILCQNNAEMAMEVTRKILTKLKLSLNEEKTKIINTRKESFNFLGFTVSPAKGYRTGKTFSLVTPSKKAMLSIRAELKAHTSRRALVLSKEMVVKRVNAIARGWVGYFYYKHCSATMGSLRYFLEARIRTYLRRKHRIRGKGYEIYPNKYLYESLGLYRIPTTAAWKCPAKALVRR